MHRSKPVSVLEDDEKVAWCLRVILCSQSGLGTLTGQFATPEQAGQLGIPRLEDLQGPDAPIASDWCGPEMRLA
jgi:hypothetical protein